MRSPSSLLILLLAGTAFANIETEDAGVLSPETPLLREVLRYLETAHVEQILLETQIRAGITRQLEGRASIPFLFRDLGSEDVNGLGDVTLRLKWSVHQEDGVMSSTRWALLFESILPTGDDDRDEGGVLLARRLQPGTGSFGHSVGGVHTIVRDRHRASAALRLRHFTRHEGFRPGPEFQLDFAYWYRLAPASFGPEAPGWELRGVLEVLTTYRFESQGAGGGAGDEGAIVWFAPGLQLYVSPSVQVECNVRAPLADGIDDALGARKWGALLAVKIRF